MKSGPLPRLVGILPHIAGPSRMPERLVKRKAPRSTGMMPLPVVIAEWLSTSVRLALSPVSEVLSTLYVASSAIRRVRKASRS